MRVTRPLTVLLALALCAPLGAALSAPAGAAPPKASAPDGNVEYDGLGHDSRSDTYRVPGGVVNPDTEVTLRFRTFHADVEGVTLRVYDSTVGHESRIPMTPEATDVSCYDKALDQAGHTCDFWRGTYTPHALGTVYYRFIAVDGAATAYYADTSGQFGGLGVATPTEQDNSWRVHVVDPDFEVVPWLRDGVMYQIFPDRFANGDQRNDPKTTDPRYAYPAPPNPTPQQQQAADADRIVNKAWTDLPQGSCAKWTGSTQPCTESPNGNDYFGGDLQGVTAKLDYLKSAGITVLYLNPIFESRSNHGYDTVDFQAVNRYLGGNKAFDALVKAAGKRGMKVVLDGVFNHLSSDSPFFDRYHHYSTVGACESPDSPYRSWFTFHPATAGTGTCAGDDGTALGASYDGWAGFLSIPVITKRDPADPSKPYAPVKQYFYGDAHKSVANRWLRQGAAGWRFDVMTDGTFPVSYWQQLRDITRGVKPSEALIAEAWHWYDNLPLTNGDTADTAMGYRFRAGVLSLLGAVDDKGFPGDHDPNVPVSRFRDAMQSLREDYSDATYYTFMNLLDSHDTKRLRWSVTPGADNPAEKEDNPANVAVGARKQALASVVQYTVPGTPTVYYGDEVGMTGADDPDDRRAYPWCLDANGRPVRGSAPYYGSCGDHDVLDSYRALAALRRSHPELRTGTQTFLLADDAAQTVAYTMRTSTGLALVALNRSEVTARDLIVPTDGYLRDGVHLKSVFDTGAAGAAKRTASDGGAVRMHLNPLSAAVYVLDGKQDIAGSAAPWSVNATGGNGTAAVRWSRVHGADSYQVLRSPLSGGGYVPVAEVTGTSYVDNGVRNGTAYHYVVRALDRAGNVGTRSAEADAYPALPVTDAVLQSPKSVDTELTSAYTTVAGWVKVAGLTDAGGDPSLVRAELGFGTAGSDPTGWSWKPMAHNPDHPADGWYEYTGGLRADAPGSYDYLVRFSTDSGHTWTYGDTSGAGDAQPGTLHVTASSDTSAPSAPVASIDFSSSALTVSWTESTDPTGPVAEYRVYRGTSAGGESSTPVAILPAATRSYVDNAVNAGETYFYQVRAYDTHLNASPASNEVSHKVEAKLVQVTFRVKVPDYTPDDQPVYVTGTVEGLPSGTADPLCGYCGGRPDTMLHETAAGSHIWEITLGIPDGLRMQWKYTRGTYDSVEQWGTITGFTNRIGTVHATSATDLTQLIDNTSPSAPSDDLKPVANWRDPLVSAASGSASGVTVTFNWPVRSDGADGDFSQSVVVAGPSGPVAGTVTAAGATLTWTPGAALPAGSYTATVDHVISQNQNNDGVPMRAPYLLTFTVP